MLRTSATASRASRMATITSSANGIRIRTTVAAVNSAAPRERRPPMRATAFSYSGDRTPASTAATSSGRQSGQMTAMMSAVAAPTRTVSALRRAPSAATPTT